jgi:SAM-dependent methyltransferase
MLTRTLEPEVMDTAQEAIDYDAMDHSAVNRLFVTDFLFAALEAGLPVEGPETGEDRSSGFVKALDLGTGTAQIPIELCRRANNIRLMAIDMAAEMLQIARRNIEFASFRERIKLDRVDGKQLPYADGRFDAIVSNSIVHHIPEPRAVLAEAIRVTRPGGLIFIRDLLRPDDEATIQHLVATYASDCNDHQRAMFDASLHAALNLDEIRALVTDLGFPADSVRTTSDRHWTWTARLATPAP